MRLFLTIIAFYTSLSVLAFETVPKEEKTVEDVLNMGVRVMPVSISEEFGSIYVKLGFEDLKFIRNSQVPNGESSEESSATYAKAFAEVEFPFLPEQSDGTKVVAFEGDVFFKKENPEQTSRIYLKNNLTLPFFDNIAELVLVSTAQDIDACKLSDRCYIEFNCNGITDVYLAGYLKFKKDLMVPVTRGSVTDKIEKPTTEQGENEQSKETEAKQERIVWKEYTNKDVVATFDFHAKDGITSKLCFNLPFKMKKAAKDFVFEIHDAILDLSTSQNAKGFQLPSGYYPAGFDEDAWVGVALKELTCYFPEDFNLNEGKEVTSASIYNMLIDEYGFSGTMTVKNLINKEVGKSDGSGVNISLDKLSAEVLQNHFMKGEIAGNVSIPFLRKTDERAGNMADDKGNAEDEKSLKESEQKGENPKLSFSARVSLVGKRYGFAGSCQFEDAATFKVPFTDKATVTLNPGTRIEIGTAQKAVENVTGSEAEVGASIDSTRRLDFNVVMNGSLDIKSAGKSTGGSKKLGFDCNFKGMAFEGLRFSNVGRPVSIKHISTKGSVGVHFMGMSITIDTIGWNDEKASYGSDVVATSWGGLNFASTISLSPKDGGSIGANFGAKFKFYNSVQEDNKWHFGGIDVNRIGLHADIGAIKLDGSLDIYKDDETFGKGFKGQIQLEIKPVDISAGVQVCFGTAPTNYKYWFTKANCSFPGSGLPVFSGLNLKSLSGGVYYKMSDPSSAINPIVEKEYDPKDNPGFKFANVSNYEPNDQIGFGLILGMGLNVGGENMAKIQAEAQLSFSSTFALDKIVFGGDFSILSPTPPFVETLSDALGKVQDAMDKLNESNKVLCKLKDGYLKLSDKEKKDDGSENKFGNIPMSDGSIHGWACASYKPSDKRFRLDAQVIADYGEKILYGEANCNLLIEKGRWYFRVGTDRDPAYLKVLGGIGLGRAYFMTGELPYADVQSLSPNADEKFEMKTISSSELDEGESSTPKASGLAFGVNAQVKIDFDNVPLLYAGFYLEGGTDLVLKTCKYQYEGVSHKWRGYGSIYGALGIDLGVQWPFPEKKWSVIKADAFFGLKGAVPVPVQGEAVASFYVEVAGGLIEAWKDVRVRVGDKKQITCNN